MSIDINAGHLGLTAGYSALVYSKSYDERANTAYQNAVNLFFTDSLPASPLDDAVEGIRNVVEAVRGFEQPTRDVINAVSDLFQH